ncbi:MAG: methionine--tRNA ligase subunit beta [Pirellulales bacterium]|nr:methionine--tRNA ligase subunit beta [Pirellulales bacterium]
MSEQAANQSTANLVEKPAETGSGKPPVTYDDFAKLELRVAKVLAAREHPNANKLLLLEIEVGSVRKQIVAGIRGHYTPEDLVGRLIVVVNNLEPATIRGEQSYGMLLAASDGTSVILLRPDKECASGSGVK